MCSFVPKYDVLVVDSVKAPAKACVCVVDSRFCVSSAKTICVVD